ncbi:MAG: sigma 54-interacting transcriptional regulator [Deltaproteobacteria bacterium]|nr:sigma 54-interacting transcriptional regulator [Deltaproteobacteria bacterium]
MFSTRTLSIAGGTISDDDGRRIDVGASPILLGRHPSCGFVVGASGVSGIHAEITAGIEGVVLRDLASKNGTWLDDVRIHHVVLTGPTTFQLGRCELRFEPTRPERIALPDIETFGPLVGASVPMRDLFRRLAVVAPTELSVLIQGETGTGKELVASAIHSASARRDGPFVVVDCGGLPPSLAEAALFGHEKGAYTGADTERRSPFVEASGGTVFLDELGELPPEVQPKLLRALAERRVKPVGSNRWIPFDARIVAATRRDLERAITTESFRSDLYFRIAEVRVSVPPLRQHLDDLPILVRHMLTQQGAKGAWRRIPRSKLTPLYHYDWPGNVRELRSAVSVALAMAGAEGTIDLAAAVGVKTRTPGRARPSPNVERSYHEAKREALARFERAYFAELLETTGANVAEMSRRSGLQRTYVRRYLRAHGLR